MRAVFISLGSVSALLVLTALLVPGAGGEDQMVVPVTTPRCHDYDRNKHCRVRIYDEDVNATHLKMGGCELTELDGRDIMHLPNVTNIHINNNEITTVDLAIFRSAPKLSLLDFSGNELRELPAFPEGSCPRLRSLWMGDNHLTAINANTFSACAELMELSFVNNHISYIHPDVFSSLIKLINLDLSNNEIAYIPDQMFLGKNFFNFDISGNRLSYAPRRMARHGKHAFKFFFDRNPWNCACLLELVVDANRAGVRDGYYHERFDGTRPQCVYTGAAPCPRRPPTGLLGRPPPAIGSSHS